jgi:hypothetical protein
VNKVTRYWKAIAGLIAPAVVTVVAAVQGSSPGGTHITGGEWALIVVAALGTSGTVAAFPQNKPKPKA